MLNHNFKYLLATTLCEKPESYVISQLFSRFNSIQELFNAKEEELTSVPGIGPVKAKAIVSALQLSRTLTTPSNAPNIIRCPNDIYELVRMDMMFLPKEHFVTIFLNTKNHVISKETISIGSLNAAIVHPREVYRSAIKRNSASIVCVHNHPSGDPQPSNEDIVLTKRLAEAGTIIGIELLDHCVIGHNKYISLKESGLF